MRIAIIGNSGGGKTTLSRRLVQIYNIPLHSVDSYQFMPGMLVRPHAETAKILMDIQMQPAWLIDGFGPLEIIEKRFAVADKIIFVDFPIIRHFWWSTKRQIKNIWSPRSELPEGCNELTTEHTVKLYKTIWRVHTKMRPELLKIFARDANENKMVYIRNLREWKKAFQNGV